MLLTTLVVALPVSAVQASPAPQVAVPAQAEAYYLFLEARRLEGEGEIAAAIAAHRRALELAPDAADIHAELAGLFARQNRVDEAVAAGEAALALDPANREANRILGFVRAARVEGRPGALAPDAAEIARRAIAHFETARGGRPGDPGSELTLGRLYVLVGDYDRGLVVLSDFLIDQPGYLEAIFLVADAHAGKGDLDAAAATLEPVIQAQPGNVRTAMRLADLYEQGGRWGAAADLYARLMTATPRMAPALAIRHATALINAERLDEARAVLSRMAVNAPADAGVWYLAAQAALRAGALDEAERAANEIAALDARDPRAAVTLADIWLARGKPARALDVLDGLLAESETGTLAAEVDELVLPRAAQVYAALERHDRAVAVLERLVRRTPDNDALKFELAAAYEQASRPADAERLFREIIGADPRHALALNYLGYMLADSGERLDEAVSLVSRALEIEPGNPSYEDSLGWAYFKQGRYELAATHLAKAAAAASTSSIIQDHYGDALFALKRYEDAIAAWRRALEGDRSDIVADAIERKIARARELDR